MNKITVNGIEMDLKAVYGVAIRASRKLDGVIAILRKIAPEETKEVLG